MTAHNDLDRILSAWFAADATQREPEHLLGAVLFRTARTRRRSAWLVPERWIPMSAISTRTAASPRVPWRLVGAAALLILALIVGAVLLAGSQPTRLPAPYGLAANGLVAYDSNGDIYMVDAATGNTRAVLTGPDTDLDPTFSLDGTHFAFRRQQADDYLLYVARADGGGVTQITPEPLGGIDSISFSPDGLEVMFTFLAGPDAPSKIAIAKADGSGLQTLELGMPATEPTFRPPDGAEIAFIGTPTSDPEVDGVYLVNPDGTGLQTLVEPSRSNTAESPKWSPDGSLLAYDAADFTVTNWTVQPHVIAPDGQGDRTLPVGDALWGGGPEWSNDGTRLAIVRGYSASGDGDVVVAVVPADGGPAGVATARSILASWPAGIAWAPDDTAVLVTQPSTAGPTATPLLIDPQTGAARPAPWMTSSEPGWQRLAR
jgi:Tol biopolymer transport system component